MRRGAASVDRGAAWGGESNAHARAEAGEGVGQSAGGGESAGARGEGEGQNLALHLVEDGRVASRVPHLIRLAGW